MKNIAILGSTGSIGTQTLDIVDQNKEDLQVVALAAGSNITLLEKQARKYRPTLVAVWDQACAKELKENLKDTEISVVSGMDGLLAVATHPASEILVTAIVGMLGIRPTIAALPVSGTRTYTSGYSFPQYRCVAYPVCHTNTHKARNSIIPKTFTAES